MYMKEKTIKVPHYLQPFMGKKVSIINLSLYLLFALIATILTIYYGFSSFIVLWWGAQILYTVVAFFTYFSVVSNITVETSKIYEPYKKNKLIYIFANIQPIILLLISRGNWIQYVSLWGYCVICGVIIAFLKGRSLQKAVGFGAVVLALLVFSHCFQSVPLLYAILLATHIINVVFCVAVSQYLDEKF